MASSQESNHYMFISSLGTVREGDVYLTRKPHIVVVPPFAVDSIEAFRNAMINRLARERTAMKPIAIQVGQIVCRNKVSVPVREYDTVHELEAGNPKLRVLADKLGDVVDRFGDRTRTVTPDKYYVVSDYALVAPEETYALSRVQLVQGSDNMLDGSQAQIINDWAFSSNQS